MLDLVLFIVATAVVMDLIAEWRARTRLKDPVTVWHLHAVQITDLVLDALDKAIISAHARTRYHRALLHFFAPYLPVEIIVAGADAERARALVGALLGNPSPVEQAA